MANKLYESLSALMDNEADDLELRRILKALEAAGSPEEAGDSPERDDLQAKWHRYHVVSASLKQEIHTAPSRSLLEGIQAELAEEPTPVAETPVQGGTGKARKSVLQVLGQGAIAASMALAVLFTADLVMVADSDTDAAPANELAGAGMPADSTLRLRGLTGELNPTTETQVAIQNELGDAELDRLSRVVSEELEDSLQRPEVPATFVPQENP